MRTYLFFDVEATGLRDFKLELSDPAQPRVMQVAAVLTDEDGNRLDEMNCYVKPDGWTVPEHITEITGITTELLEADGLPMPQVLERFNEMKAQCTHRVGHNVSYDKQMMLREEFAYNLPHDSEGKETICTMKMSRPFCQLPKNKPPKLAEAYQILCGGEMIGAHDAWADVDACMKVYFAVKKLVAANDQGDASRPAGQGEG